MRIVISYDISDDRRRSKIARILEGHGYRVQYSVFECDLDQKSLNALKKRLRALVKADQMESVRFYPLYSECAANVQVLGKDLRQELGAVSVI